MLHQTEHVDGDVVPRVVDGATAKRESSRRSRIGVHDGEEVRVSNMNLPPSQQTLSVPSTCSSTMTTPRRGPCRRSFGSQLTAQAPVWNTPDKATTTSPAVPNCGNKPSLPYFDT